MCALPMGLQRTCWCRGQFLSFSYYSWVEAGDREKESGVDDFGRERERERERTLAANSINSSFHWTI